MKIGFVYFHSFPNVGGTEIPMLEYAKALVSRGHDVTIFTANAISFRPANLPTWEKVDGVRIERFSCLRFPFKYLFLAPGLIRKLLTANLDVIQVFAILPSSFLLCSMLIAKLRHVPLISYPQFHPDRFKSHPSLLARMFGTIFDRTFAMRMLTLADFIISLTLTEEKFYRSRGLNRVATIYEWIPRRLEPTTSSINSFREKYGLKLENKHILFVGRIEKRKGLQFIIRIFPRILARIPNARLLIVGRDWGVLSEIMENARSLGCQERITCTGSVDDWDLASAYRVSKVIIVPSQFEAYGRTVLEAWTYSKPVIISDRVALGELVTPDCGIVAPLEAEDKWTDALTSVLSDDHLGNSMGISGNKLAKKVLLDVESIAGELESIYTTLIPIR